MSEKHNSDAHNREKDLVFLTSRFEHSVSVRWNTLFDAEIGSVEEVERVANKMTDRKTVQCAAVWA